jgi:hypothetical protein
MRHFPFDERLVSIHVPNNRLEYFEFAPTLPPHMPPVHHRWAVTSCLRYLARLPDPVSRILYVPIDETFRRTWEGFRTDKDDGRWKSDECNPHRACVFVEINGTHCLIDGSHRVMRALAMGWEQLPAVLLTPEEDWQFRCCGCCKPQFSWPPGTSEDIIEAHRREVAAARHG